MEGRKHRRVRLRLPARLRWSTPLGARSEVTETIDVSRGGLLVSASLEHAPGTPVWVAFPYDDTRGRAQPEIAGRVVWVEAATDGANGAGPRRIALQLLNGDASVAANGAKPREERRSEARSKIALPVGVRPEYAPWAEEAMTVDVSANGLRFVTTREFECGERLRVRFGAVAPAGWPVEREVQVQVTRVTVMSDRVSLETAAQRLREPA